MYEPAKMFRWMLASLGMSAGILGAITEKEAQIGFGIVLILFSIFASLNNNN